MSFIHPFFLVGLHARTSFCLPLGGRIRATRASIHHLIQRSSQILCSTNVCKTERAGVVSQAHNSKGHKQASPPKISNEAATRRIVDARQTKTIQRQRIRRRRAAKAPNKCFTRRARTTIIAAGAATTRAPTSAPWSSCSARRSGRRTRTRP